MTLYDVRDLSPADFRDLAREYDENGFVRLQGVEALTEAFRAILAERLQVDDAGLREILATEGPRYEFPVEVRKRLARIETSDALAELLVTALRPVLERLLGPLIHVSSTYHGQFKSGGVRPVDHGGYGEEYQEVLGRYLMHQDFAGARMPTSPSMVTFWLGMNECPDWKLRLYPRSHRLGLLCHEWMDLNDERLGSFGDPVDFPAEPGKAVLFNSLLVHGTGDPGPARRVSCDLRFFPMCGFLPSRVRSLSDDPAASLERLLETAPGPVLQSPCHETSVWLGRPVDLDGVEPCSVLNWVQYISRLSQGDADGALPWLERFVNTERGIDPPEVYVEKFHDRTIHEQTLEQGRALLAGGR